jgi:hypothetical protein
MASPMVVIVEASFLGFCYYNVIEKTIPLPCAPPAPVVP